MSQSEKPDLKKTLDEAEWTWLKSHAQRDGLIVIAPDLDILDAGYSISEDDKARVQAWIQSGKISKPTAQQIALWDKTPTKRFMSLVVQPYVLIQELLLH